MKQLIFLVSLILLAGMCIVSCDDVTETLDPKDKGFGYFPLEVGKYIEYQVDSIIFDDAPAGTNVKDTISVFILERVTEMFLDEAGDTTYRLEISRRVNASDPWKITDVWTAQRNANEAIKVEENQRFVKLRFPTEPGLEWNSLVYMNPEIIVQIGTETIEMYKNWSSEIITIDSPEIIGEHSFDNVLTCVHANDDNEIELRYVEEKYAKGVGMVSREMHILDSRCIRLGELQPCALETWDEKAEKGFILKQTILNFN